MPKPAQQLLGLTLDGGWTVIEHIERPSHASGGTFSEGYLVKRENGGRGFLKAMDYAGAMELPNRAEALHALTATYLFETTLLKRCRDKNLDHVVAPLDFGSVTVDANNPVGMVEYIIFELADGGDIRNHLNSLKTFDTAFLLRTLHHLTVGLTQLHTQGIAHQDVKPSNVMIFAKQQYSKIGDLGRAAAIGENPPHDSLDVPGDPSYAPPELLYGFVPEDWNARRFGCDAYLLGSMVVFLFSGVSTTCLMMDHLGASQQWSAWQGSFKAILPFLRNSFDMTLNEFRLGVPVQLQDQLERIVRQLCDPDPALRGHPRTRAEMGNAYSLQRYVSEFNLLASKAELGLLGGTQR